MNINIKPLKDLSEVERNSFFKLEEKAFGTEEGSENFQVEEHEEEEMQWVPSSDWHVFVWEEDILVGHVEFSERTIQVGNDKIEVACIGGVCTDPNYRKKGYAKAAINAAHEFINQNMNVSHCALLTGTEQTPFYQQFNYSVVDAPCVMQQKRGIVSFDDIFMVCAMNNTQWLTGNINLCGLPW